jgi:hypothetical protein
MLSLRVNKLAGAIPADWDTPLLEMLLLSDNSLTGDDGPRPGACGGCAEAG